MFIRIHKLNMLYSTRKANEWFQIVCDNRSRNNVPRCSQLNFPSANVAIAKVTLNSPPLRVAKVLRARIAASQRRCRWR
jgi:hypothetical protein